MEARAEAIERALAAEQLNRSAPVQSAWAAIVTGQVALVVNLDAQIKELRAAPGS